MEEEDDDDEGEEMVWFLSLSSFLLSVLVV